MFRFLAIIACSIVICPMASPWQATTGSQAASSPQVPSSPQPTTYQWKPEDPGADRIFVNGGKSLFLSSALKGHGLTACGKKSLLVFSFEGARLQPCRILLRMHPASAAEVPFFLSQKDFFSDLLLNKSQYHPLLFSSVYTLG